jgi:hypothetical protein
MHYRNGREAKNGDKVASIGNDGQIITLGVLYDAKPENDYCNGSLAPLPFSTMACLCDCLHIDDVADLLKKADLNKRPINK